MSTRKHDSKATTSSISKKKTPTKPTTKTKESSDKKADKEEEKQIKIASSSSSNTQVRSRNVSKTRNTVNSNSRSSSKAPQTLSHSSNVTKTSLNKKSSRKNPTTPPSNRVMKTQYFPSKDLYSNALNTSNHTPIVESNRELRENSKSKKHPVTKIDEKKNPKKTTTTKIKRKSPEPEIPKTLTLAEVKKRMRQEKAAAEIREEYFADVSPDTSSMSERPRTATLRKGSIVNTNIVGPDAPKRVIQKPAKPKSPSPEHSSEDYNYEDDFESYESDFDEYSSSETSNVVNISGEETSSDNENHCKQSNPPEITIFTERKLAPLETEDEKKLDSGNYELPDFKHRQMLGNIQELIEKENANLEHRANPASLSDEGFEEQKSLQFINFLDAKKKCDRRKSSALKRKRGEEILSMIRLNTVNFTLFDLESVPYDVFIKIYGSNNTVQTSVQTGEEDVCEETQTESIPESNKWTQFPATFSKTDQKDEYFWDIYKCNYFGVGGDTFSKDKHDVVNEIHLNKFLYTAADLIANVITEESIEHLENINKNKRNIPFSDGYLSFNTNREELKQCSIDYVTICSNSKNKIMTVHKKKELHDDTDAWKSLICLWDIVNLDKPQKELICHGDLSCCSFCVDLTQIILAGQNNGTICIWNIGECSQDYDISNTTPCVVTKFNEGHKSKIVSIECYLDESQNKLGKLQSNRCSISVCSLSEDGELILWTLYLKTIQDLNNVIFVQNSLISLQANFPELVDLQCKDLILCESNGSFVYIATNYGLVLYCLLEDKNSLRKYQPGLLCEATCLEGCPFSPNYFFCGHINGDINLYSKTVQKPLIVLSSKDGNQSNAIDILRWSRNRPFILYAKDSTNTINIWNLEQSDIFPIYSVPFPEQITCLKLSALEDSGQDNMQHKSYMIIGTESGKLVLHLLNTEHGQQSQDFYRKQVDTFLEYVTRL